MENFFLQDSFCMEITLTHLGMVCALGTSLDEILSRAEKGDVSGMRPRTDLIPGQTVVFGETRIETTRAMRCYDLLAAALEQIKQPVRALKDKYAPDRIGIVLGVSNTGVHEVQQKIACVLDPNAHADDFPLELLQLGVPADFVKKQIGVTGPVYSVSTACSSAAKAFGAARRLLQNDVCDAVIVGGADAVCSFATNGFYALEALSLTRTNPFSKNRSGINLGEGAALFIMEKNAPGIHLLGIGESSDAYHLTGPCPDGAGAASAMRLALQDSGLSPDEIDYINLHGTGTVHNDAMESRAVFDVFGKRPLCASTKSMTGHVLGASGAIELGLSWLMLRHGGIIPHVFDGERDETLAPITLAGKQDVRPVRRILSNSFAFGGSNAAVIIGGKK